MTQDNSSPPVDLTQAALVLIDLQNGMVAMPTAPHSGSEIVTAASALARRFRSNDAPVVLVNAAFPVADDSRARPDVVLPLPESMPPGWDELAEALNPQPSDLRITKHAWGAFLGTDLDNILKSRNVKTVVVGGIATNFGVESTAREAASLGYDVVIASDASASVSAEHHDFSIQYVMPMLGRVRTVSEIVG